MGEWGLLLSPEVGGLVGAKRRPLTQPPSSLPAILGCKPKRYVFHSRSHTHPWPFLINVRFRVGHVFSVCPVLDQRSPGDRWPLKVCTVGVASMEFFPGLKAGHHPQGLFPGEGFSRVQSAKQRKDPANNQCS